MLGYCNIYNLIVIASLRKITLLDLSVVFYPDSVWLQFSVKMGEITVQINELKKPENRKSEY